MSGKLFAPSNRHASKESELIYARYEWWIILNNFFAAMMFVIGSFMYLSESLSKLGTWFFIIGSFCFAVSPTLHLIRGYRLAKAREYDELAEDYQAENPKIH